MYAFHGSSVENFYSIVHNGLLNLFNKVRGSLGARNRTAVLMIGQRKYPVLMIGQRTYPDIVPHESTNKLYLNVIFIIAGTRFG